MKTSYLDLSSGDRQPRHSDLRDGLKHHCRILYAMKPETRQKATVNPPRCGAMLSQRRSALARMAFSNINCRFWTVRATLDPWTATIRPPCASPKCAWTNQRPMAVGKDTVDFQDNYDGRTVNRLPAVTFPEHAGQWRGRYCRRRHHRTTGEVIDASA
jgi:hypothetical protein